MKQGWLLALLSTALSVCGSLVIYIDDVYQLIFPKFITKKYPFELKENFTFLVASLGFSSGCLMFTAIYSLLPSAKRYLEETENGDRNLMICFWIGILLSLGLNGILHLMTSESVVHCSHEGHEGPGQSHRRGHNDGHNDGHHDGHHDSYHDDHHDDHNHSHIHINTHHQEGQDEGSPLLPTRSERTLSKKFLVLDIFKKPVGECKGYSSAEICVNDSLKLHYCELPSLTSEPHHEIHLVTIGSDDMDTSSGLNHLHEESDHHHHVHTPLSRLFSIGIQTTLALTCHKLPEGFMTYITSEANSKLGLQIFLSLAVHNFIEGFSMCLPLYYSFSNGSGRQAAKFKALIIAAGLGGCSQPLGALMGQVFLQHNPVIDDPSSVDLLNKVFGITLAVTSGFITVIGLSMFASAVGFNNRSANLVVMWNILGVFVIGVTSLMHK